MGELDLEKIEKLINSIQVADGDTPKFVFTENQFKDLKENIPNFRSYLNDYNFYILPNEFKLEGGEN